MGGIKAREPTDPTSTCPVLSPSMWASFPLIENFVLRRGLAIYEGGGGVGARAL